ncbi:hypothetical protein ACHAXA_006420 [Cyclostephanos tholiformis]|uniref:P-type Ca(2+) transporter n=1 Tax=Cyclostephanos tholiformis TaxID=382380 RepID=A0ABD3R0E1_9STRA
MGGNDDNHHHYPYARNDECSWHPEEVARRLGALVPDADGRRAGGGGGGCGVVVVGGGGGGRGGRGPPPPGNRRGGSVGADFAGGPTNADTNLDANTCLLTRGRSTNEIRALRRAYGGNTLHGDRSDDVDVDVDGAASRPNWRRWTRWRGGGNNAFHSRCIASISPILRAFYDQLKEPLILMLLFSASISLCLGNGADALSIGMALVIVSLVAAIQEYRSERGESSSSSSSSSFLECFIPESFRLNWGGSVGFGFGFDPKLADLVPHTCTVLRDGRAHDHFPAKELVIGDLVILTTGDRVPADVRVIDCVELSVDESSLTGENGPVSKTGMAIPALGGGGGGGGDDGVDDVCDDNVSGGGGGSSPLSTAVLAVPPPITEQRNIVFMGTLVVAGRGRGLVVAVGERTEFGKVAKELGGVESRRSPLQIKIDELSRLLAYASTVGITIMALVGYLLGRPFLETVTVAVSLAVAAIPEGLPICVTVTLALGVLRMARHSAIVKKLPAVETLGCCTVIASDKTGTLTQNEMTARSIYTLAFPRLCFGLTGVGYDVRRSGGFLVRGASDDDLSRMDPASLSSTGGCKATSSNSIGRKVSDRSPEFEALLALFGTASICNNASVSTGDDDDDDAPPGGVHMGQPTEMALLVGSAKANVPDPRPMYHRLQEIPFSSDRKRMEVKCRPVGGRSAHTCTAFALSARKHSASGGDLIAPDGSLYFVKGMPESILGECQTYTAADGSALPLTEAGKSQALTQSRRMATCGLRVLAMAYGPSLGSLTFAGIVGLEDPPREGVIESVAHLERSGVQVIMVTGDSKETAVSIARRCGILGGGRGRSETIAAKNDTDASEGLLATIPLRSLNGDQLTGLKGKEKRGRGGGAADIGIAMGKGGTDVAKEAADVVLADDDFTTIVRAVAEGKGIFFNIRNFLSFQLSTSFAALMMESVATAFRLPSPLNAMQILWINIIMDGPPAQSLGVEPVDERILRAPPRKVTDPIVTRALLTRATMAT